MKIAYRKIDKAPSFLTDKAEFKNRNRDSQKAELTYDEYESILYAIKLQRQLASKEENTSFVYRIDSYSFSIITSLNKNYRIFDVKYWKEVPQVEELKAILSDLPNKLIAFNKAENTNIGEINLVIVGRLFVLRTIQANINTFCEVKNTVVRFFEENSLREIYDYSSTNKYVEEK